MISLNLTIFAYYYLDYFVIFDARVEVNLLFIIFYFLLFMFQELNQHSFNYLFYLIVIKARIVSNFIMFIISQLLNFAI